MARLYPLTFGKPLETRPPTGEIMLQRMEADGPGEFFLANAELISRVYLCAPDMWRYGFSQIRINDAWWDRWAVSYDQEAANG